MPAGRNKSSEGPEVSIVGCKKTRTGGRPPTLELLDLSGDPAGAATRSVLLCLYHTTTGGGLSSPILPPPAGTGRPATGHGGRQASRGRQPATAGRARAGGLQGQGAGYRATPAGQRARAGAMPVLRPLIAPYSHFYFKMVFLPTMKRKRP